MSPRYFLLFPSRSLWTAAAGPWTWATHPAFQSSFPILSLYLDVAGTNSLPLSCLNFLLTGFLLQARFNLALIKLKCVSSLVFLKHSSGCSFHLYLYAFCSSLNVLLSPARYCPVSLLFDLNFSQSVFSLVYVVSCHYAHLIFHGICNCL